MKVHWLVIVTIALAVASAGCGAEAGDPAATGKGSGETVTEHEPRKPRPLDLTIGGYPTPEYGGLYLAQERGYFEQAGLWLSIHSPVLPAKPIPYVVEGSADLVVSHEPEVILARERGAPVIAIGALIRHPTTALIWLPRSGIHTMGDLRGKTIATEGLEYQERLLKAVLAKEGIGADQVDLRTVGYGAVSALEGQADAAIVSSPEVEEAQLREDGQDPVIVPFAELGLGGYEELVVVAQQRRLRRMGGEVRDFMAALTRGNRAAKNQPAAAARLVARERSSFPPKIPPLDPDTALPFLSGTGQMDAGQWRHFTERMKAAGIIDGHPPVSRLLTNAYAP